MSTSLNAGARVWLAWRCGLAGMLGMLDMSAAAAAAPLLDLASFVEQAERNDPGIAAARADMVVGQEGRLRARAGLFPRIEGSWTRSNSQQQYDGLPAMQYQSRQRQITLTQPLFDGAALVGYRQAEAQEARKQLQLLQASQALRIKAVERYFAALAARDEAALNADTDAALQGQLASARARLQAGEATLTDLRDIEAELARSANSLATARTQVQLRRREMAVMLGRAMGELDELGELAGLSAQMGVPVIYPDDLESWATQAQGSHPEVQLRVLDQRLAALATDRTRTDFLPRLSLQANYGNSSSSTVGFTRYPASSTNSVSIQLNIPIFSGFDTVHGVRQGLAQQDKAAHDTEQARRQALTDVGDSFAQAQSQRHSIDQLTRYVAAAEAALQATRIGYQVGNRRETDLLQKQNVLWGARRELLRARYEALVQGLRLKALTASLAIEDIRAVNALLEPAPAPAAASAR